MPQPPGDAFTTLGLTSAATPQEVKQAYKELSKQRHPDRVAPARRVAAEADFKVLGQAYNAALRRATAAPGAPISVHTVNAVREARASAAGSRRIWLTPSVIPLAAAFGMLAALTYYQAGVLMAHNRQSHRPHGLLGPAVNEFVDEDEGDDSEAKAERDSRIRQSYRSRLHSQRGQAVPADAGKQASS